MTTIKVIKTAATALGAAALITTMLAGSASATPAHGFGATISNSGNGTSNTVVAPARDGTVTSRRQHGLLNVEPAATPMVFCSPRGCAPPPKPLPPLGKPLKGRS